MFSMRCQSIILELFICTRFLFPSEVEYSQKAQTEMPLKTLSKIRYQIISNLVNSQLQKHFYFLENERNVHKKQANLLMIGGIFNDTLWLFKI